MRLQSFVLLAAFLFTISIASPQDAQVSTFITVITVEGDGPGTPLTTISYTVETVIPSSTTSSKKPDHSTSSESIPLNAPPTKSTSQSTTDGSSTNNGVTSSPTSTFTSATITPPYMRPNQTANGYANATASSGGQNNTGLDLGNGSGGSHSGGGSIVPVIGAVGGIVVLIVAVVMVYCCCCRDRGSSHDYKQTSSVESIPLVVAPKANVPKVTVPKIHDAPEAVPLVSQSGTQAQSLPKPTPQSQPQVDSIELTELPAPATTPHPQVNFVQPTELPAQAAMNQPQVRFTEPTELPAAAAIPQTVTPQAPGGWPLPPQNPYAYDPYHQSGNMNNYFPPQQPYSYQPPYNPYQPPPHNPYNP